VTYDLKKITFSMELEKMDSSKLKAPGHIFVPDALRAFAILSVVINHLFSFTHPSIGSHVLRLGFIGAWGVSVFFVLSGFLLGKDYLLAIVDNRPLPNTWRFYSRRFLRIYPLYLFAVAVSVALVALLLRPISTTTVVEHIFMLQATSETSVYAVNGPLWTMGVDAAFYIMLPPFMGLLFALTRSIQRRPRIAVIIGALAGVFIASVTYRWLQTLRNPETLISSAANAVHVETVFGMATAFALGIGAALLVMLVPKRQNHTLDAFLVLFGALIAITELVALQWLKQNGQGLAGELRITLIDPLASFSAVLILYGLVQGGVNLVSQVARLKIVTSFASLAYAIYLLHYPILEVVDTRALGHRFGILALGELTVAFIIFVIPIAYLAHRFIEQPFLDIKSRMPRDNGTGREPDPLLTRAS
jgi:peptidoglycan/LPS O-acetylase OafA/YrhL